ncbi:TAT-variant-translocated molybdopterin oxidoreductase [Ferruginibacter sp. SUN002]|uniref:TAT-variant-translocated molybdopterin oxidoreductase n=1 Tax=Ferruginibacter sp. SUN002 TaxID=2937789 RepID=UPI003D3681DF
MEKKYWQNFGELNQTEAFEQSAKNEFKEELLPIEELDNGMLNAKTPRRDFLKYLGFSTAAATIAASCEMPVRKAVPYLQKPDNLIPGVANYYASTYVSEGDAVPVIVKQRDGRPIKIEGNEASKITGGGTSAQAQASVLDLYDITRLRYPMQNDGKAFKEVPTFDAFDRLISEGLTAQAGKPVVVLTSTISSPSTLQIISEFLAKQPAGSRHVQYDAVSYSGMLLANEACYGKKALPSYHFDNAKVIVSLAADFLGTWLSPVEFSAQYAKGRRVTADKKEMSRHIQFESGLSLTGSNADDRFTHKPSEKAAVALALLAKLTGTAGPSISNPALAKGIETAAAALAANKGAALVVCGSNDVNLQIVVNAINEAIGANGKTINWASTSNYRKGIDADVVKLVDEMNAGSIGAVFVYDANPAYSYYDSKKFVDGLKKVPVSVSFNATMDETTEACKYVISSHNWLESWGDAEPKTGFFAFQQPVINPLFKTRAFQTSLLKWTAGATVTDYETYFKTYWTTKLTSADAYNTALQTGLVEPAEITVAAGTFNAAGVAAASAKLAQAKGGKFELAIYQKVSVGTGKQANNPWLQELPDPISKVTWDNYAMVSPAFAKAVLGLDVLGNQRQGDSYEVTPEKPTIKITLNGKSVELPVLIIPGVQADTVAVAVGYGRSSANKEKTAENIGPSANGAGVNIYPLVWKDENGFRYSAPVDVVKTGNTYAVAQTQVHGSSESRPVIFETSLAQFIEDPTEVLAEPRHERAMLLPYKGKDFRKDATIYPDNMEEKPGIKWGMNIDLNTCTGCSACVVACTAENNVSVVGKTQVMRAHEMHWLRIDRYFTGDMNNPDVVFQPMLCQHCDNAPCENVCPVAATNHSSEGLNQMTYNRCIGTRYCANNCPFKVRRFNWLDYTGADSFKDNQRPLIGVDMDESVMQMNDDLTRMVLNPDVTVRSRGVIEKCSFCVQRLQESKLAAKKAEDPTMIRTVKTACMQACPTHAISFGNVHDKESEVAKLRKDDNRTFYVLEQLHVLPNVSYQVKIKNTDRHVTNEKPKEGEGHSAAEKKAEPAHH